MRSKKGLFEKEIVLSEDKYLMQVLGSIIAKPKSAKQISYEAGIPLPTVHRKLKILESNDFLIKSGRIVNGVRERLFQRKKICDQDIR